MDLAPLLLILKVTLTSFIVGGTVALIARGVRRSRTNRLDPNWKGRGIQPGYAASVYGVMPNTPLPEWADRDDDHEDGRGLCT